MIRRMYKYRIYPSKKQQQIFNEHIDICRFWYNQQLENKIIWYQDKDVNLSFYDLNHVLVDSKIIYPKLKQIHSSILIEINQRIIRAFNKFFKEFSGYPRFKGKNRYNSFTYYQGFEFISKNKLKLSKIGEIHIKLHRSIQGKIKTLTIKKSVDKWFAYFSCEVPDIEIANPSKERIGIDVGLEHFATLSNGETIANPRFLIKSEKRLKMLHRRLSRKVKGSANRGKARFRLAKQYLKVSNQRNDFMHKLSKSLTIRYGIIAIEDLNIKTMVKNHWLAKSISDASWGTFINMLSYKAVTSGGQLIKVNPRGTSKTCSECGNATEMPLNKREFICSICGFACHRDILASNNILSTIGTMGSNASGAVPLGTTMNEETTNKW